MADIDSMLEQLGSAPAGYATPQQIQQWRDTANALSAPTRPQVYTWASGLNDFTRSISSALHNRWANSAEQRNQAGLAANIPGTGLDPTGGSPSPAGPGPSANNTDAAVSQAAVGDPYISRTMQIESGMDPNNQTGSNRGYGQFSPDLEKKYGINDSNRTDINQQAAAIAMNDKVNSPHLAATLGRPPSPGERYLSHQQGIAGGPALADPKNANLPAWRVVRPFYKSDEMAQKAITGNVGKDAPFYGAPADMISAGGFKNYWVNKFESGMPRPPQQAAGAPPPGAPAAAPGAIDPKFPPGQITTLPQNAPPSAGVPPPPNASAAPPPAQSPIQPAAFHPPSPAGGLPDNPTTVQAQTFAPGGQQTGGPGMPQPGAQPAAAPGQAGPPKSLPLPPGTPTDDQIHNLLRNPHTEALAIQMQQEKIKLLSDQVVSQPDGTVWMGNPFRNNWRQLPYMSKPDIIKSPIKTSSGTEVEQNLVPTRGPDGTPGLREINPMLNGQGGGAPGAQSAAAPVAAPGGPPPGGGIQPASNVQPAAAAPSPGLAPAAPGSIPGFVKWPENPTIDSIQQMGAQNAIAKNVEQKTQEAMVTARMAPVTEAITAGQKVPTALQQLGTLRQALADPGLSTGVLGEQFQHMKSAFKQLTGVDLGGVTAGERIAKINTALAFSATAEATKRPAWMEIQMQKLANPGLLNSVETSKYLVNVMEQEQRQKLALANIASNLNNPKEYAHERDVYYEHHPVLSPLTGKPLNDTAEANKDIFALHIKAGASPGKIEEVRKQLGMTPEQSVEAQAYARNSMAPAGGQPAAPAAAAPAQTSKLPTPSSIQEAYKLGSGTQFIIPDGPHAGKTGTVP